MTNSDKLEIDMLFQNINTMKAYSEKIDEPYIDDDIKEYATQAMINATDIHTYIQQTIQKNIHLFFDFSKPIEISDDDGVKVRDGKNIAFDLGAGIQIIVHIKRELLKDFQIGTYKATFMTVPEAFEVSWVRPKVYECERKAIPKEFNLIRSEDLFFYKGNLDVFYTCGNYNSKQKVAVWNCLYQNAQRTRSKTEMLMRFFKKLLTEKCAMYKKRIEKTESELEKAKCVDKYTIIAF